MAFPGPSRRSRCYNRRMAWQALLHSWVRDQLLKQLRASAFPSARSAQPGPAGQSCQAAFLFALPEEAGGLVDRLKDAVTTRAHGFSIHQGRLAGRAVVVAESGVGRQAASRAAEAIISAHRPALFVSTGFAAGLDERLNRGDVMIASEVVVETGEPISLHPHLDAAPVGAPFRIHVGRLLSVDRLVAEPADKRRLGETTGAIALDMETFAVAEVCRGAATPLIAIRIVSDAVGDRLPREVGRLLRQKTLAGKLGALTGAVLSRPSSVKDFYRLKEDALAASDKLADILEAIVRELPAPADDESDARV
jgi:adenosylhomocysteine nucleosidase